MRNIEKLKDLGVLGDLRLSYGGLDENDPGNDDRINALTGPDAALMWASWKLGDASWAKKIIEIYTAIEEMENERPTPEDT